MATLFFRSVLILCLLLSAACGRAEQVVKVPAAITTLTTTDHTPQTAVLAGGCFWGMELVFSHVKGVQEVVPGYTGGTLKNPAYLQVASGTTGHAESVRITFDPAVVRYTDLLRIYFSVAHDPTQVGGQGPDSGSQYRSEIFATDAEQGKLARAYIHQLEMAKVFAAPIATQVSALTVFYPAEAHHLHYAALHPDSLYIRFNDLPKLRALQQRFPQWYREKAAYLLAAGQ